MRLQELRERVGEGSLTRRKGRVRRVVGLLLETEGPPAAVGELCEVQTRRGVVLAEVVGFREERMLLMPLGETAQIRPEDEVIASGCGLRVAVGEGLLGQVLDGLGRPLGGEEWLRGRRGGGGKRRTAPPLRPPVNGGERETAEGDGVRHGRTLPAAKSAPSDDTDDGERQAACGGGGWGRGEKRELRALTAAAPGALQRPRIREPLPLGIRAIDGLLTCGKGQRVGIMAGAGVGKSTLLGMVARNTSADVNVIGLIGERGREVREFLERDLGEEGRARSVVVVATGEQPPLVRLRAAFTATTVAEYFRDQGREVLLMMDSLTRVAWAQRDLGLACGEPPTRNGYTPSVFTLLPQLLERAGTAPQGSITGLYAVLVEADDLGDPVADCARSVLDGHIVLSRGLAEQGHYPAVEVLQSVSRLMGDIVGPEHAQAAQELREALAVYAEAEDLINLGAYAPGSNPRLDRAVSLQEPAREFLRQALGTRTDFAETVERLQRMTAAESPPG